MSNTTAWFVGIAVTVAFGAAAAHYDAHAEIEAQRQDTEALSSREFAGQAVCGPHATPEWLDNKTLHHGAAPRTLKNPRQRRRRGAPHEPLKTCCATPLT